MLGRNKRNEKEDKEGIGKQNTNEKPQKPKTAKERFNAIRKSEIISIVFAILIPLITTVLTEWIARGTLGPHKQGNGFFQSLVAHFPSFFISFLLLVFLYIFISHISGQHWLATLLVGLVGLVPATVTYYKLTMRGEPFLPWDIFQVNDLMAVSSSIELNRQPSMIISAILLLILTVASGFIKLPKKEDGKVNYKDRLFYSGVSLAMCCILMFGIFLSPKGTAAMGIHEDMWMQDRYYRTNGVLTGFLTNLQMLNIQKPEGYSSDAITQIAETTLANANGAQPFYSTGYSAQNANAVQQPDIIFVMAESFWDVTALDGIEYDQPLLPNITAMAQQGAYGKAYTPSFGGGTCDVEFEALTGFSMEFLPAGSKAFQQYVTQDTFSLPNYLKTEGYETMAIHGYGRKFWNRDQAYPRLGIDEFIASDDFVNPDKRRGFISDDAMVDMIIEQYEEHGESGNPLFIHAVTMQNHTTYSRDRYPESELVKVTKHPDTISDNVIGQLEDCATGIREMDAALGKLANYLKTTGRPTILVFWGDHLNPMSDGFGLFEKTGFIEKGDTTDPKLYETPLLIWSNYSTNKVDLGTLATYYISPVMMDLFGLEKPVLFEYLIQQLPTYRARTRGVTVEPNNTTSLDMTDAQQEAFNKHFMLQYDFLFGNHTLESYTEKDE